MKVQTIKTAKIDDLINELLGPEPELSTTLQDMINGMSNSRDYGRLEYLSLDELEEELYDIAPDADIYIQWAIDKTAKLKQICPEFEDILWELW